MHVEVEQRARFPSCLVDNEVVKCVVLEDQVVTSALECGKSELTWGIIKSSWIAVTHINEMLLRC